MSSLKILFVTPHLGSPPRSGSGRRLEGLMRGLARRHEVSVISLVSPADELEASIRASESYCRTVVAVPNPRYALTTAQKRLLQLRSLLSRRSFESFMFSNTALQGALRAATADVVYDVINFEYMHMAVNWPADLNIVRRRTILVLDEHNIEFDLVRRTATGSRGLDRRVYSLVNWRKLRDEERYAWARFDGCTTTSERDAHILRSEAPHSRTAVVPNAVDVSFFRRGQGNCIEEPMSLLFFGTVSYHPNFDGILFLIREILPRIATICPSVTLRIVGPSVPTEIRAMAREGIEVIGVVDDIRAHLERATVVVVPLRIGGGTRFKILEAMAMEKAVVSTSIGAEGIAARDGVELLLGDTADAFASQVVRVLRNATLRRALGRAARTLIERRYSWERSVDRLEAFYGELLGQRGEAG